MKVKKTLKILGILLLCLVLAAGAAVGIFFGTYQATIAFDCAEQTGDVLKGASGYLYGIAENGVPSAEMVESLDVQTIAQKVPRGLQHPIGDMEAADKLLDGVKYEVVYLQDCYDTWYYLHDEIMQARSEGTYDWHQLLDEDYLPRVQAMTKYLSRQDYAGKLVYCLYNECDNGIWFGESQKDDNPDNQYGVWCDYNEVGRDNFNAAWEQTYALVKSIDPDALIGGPGFCDYNKDEIEYFLSFCKEHDCLPDVMIYHELGPDTVYFFDEHYREYRALEQSLGLDPLEIIITEYGMMNENGYPGEMVKIMTQFENCKVYGDNAYWRLADNLNDNCADDNSPNAQWWLMRWYADMKGQTLQCTNKDILSSNFENYFKYHLEELSFNGFNGIGALSDDGDEISVVCGGGDRKSRVQFKNLDATSLCGKEVEIRVEETVYKGLYGVVSKPVVRREYTQTLGKSLTVELGKLDKANAYHITVKEKDENSDSDYTNRSLPVRYELENGTLLGAAYTYDSYCPASGGNEEGHDMVGGMENEGDGVEIDIDIPADGVYNLDFVYGKANDGVWNENGRQSPEDRTSATVAVSFDRSGDAPEKVTLRNTIKSEYTSCYTYSAQFDKGTHTVTVQHIDGTYVLDSVVVSPADETAEIAVLPDGDRTTENSAAFLAVAPYDGYYDMQAVTAADTLTLDGTALPLAGAESTVYLRRGLNYLEFNSPQTATPVITPNAALTPALLGADKAALDGTATLQKRTFPDAADEQEALRLPAGEQPYIDGIGSTGGAATFTVNAPTAGAYRVTLTYANNDEGGVHDYNVDLIERYVTVDVNGQPLGNVYCRNTYSWDTRKTVTFTAALQEGANTVIFRNDGSERFNGNDTYAPHIYGISVNPALQPLAPASE